MNLMNKIKKLILVVDKQKSRFRFLSYFLRIFDLSSCDNLLTPISIIFRLSSDSKEASTDSTPGCPAAASPYKYGRPIEQAFAPNANALRI